MPGRRGKQEAICFPSKIFGFVLFCTRGLLSLVKKYQSYYGRRIRNIHWSSHFTQSLSAIPASKLHSLRSKYQTSRFRLIIQTYFKSKGPLVSLTISFASVIYVYAIIHCATCIVRIFPSFTLPTDYLTFIQFSLNSTMLAFSVLSTLAFSMQPNEKSPPKKRPTTRARFSTQISFVLSRLFRLELLTSLRLKYWLWYLC